MLFVRAISEEAGASRSKNEISAKTERDQAMTDSEPQSVQLRASIVSTV
jgi:hypothetical protein